MRSEGGSREARWCLAPPPGNLPDLLTSMRADHGAKMAQYAANKVSREERERLSLIYARSIFRPPTESVQATQPSILATGRLLFRSMSMHRVKFPKL